MGTNNTGTISRRSFIGGAAGVAATAGLGTATAAFASEAAVADGGQAVPAGADVPSFMIAPDPIPADQIAQTKTADVLVIGGGIGGCVTASSAVENGLTVIMVEKNEESRAVGRDFGFINGPQVLAAGIHRVDTYEVVRDFVQKSAHRVDVGVVNREITHEEAAAGWFTDKAAEWGLHPEIQAYSSTSDFYRNYDYITNYYPESGRAENSVEVNSGGRYAVMRTMLENMQQEVVDAGGEYLTSTEAVELCKADDGSITGAICKTADGTYLKVEAAATVLATGDYAADEEMFRYYSEWDLEMFDKRYSTGTGDGHKMGLWAGALMQRRPHPMMLFGAYCYAFLRVNKNGMRYVNEDSGYNGKVVSQLRQPDHLSWAVWDDKWRTEIPQSLLYGGGMAWDQDFRELGQGWTPEREEETAFSWEREEGWLVQADTLEELAVAMGLEGDAVERFLKTVERYNQIFDMGKDIDFGKRPELLTSITQPPFYALKMCTELAVSTGGLMTDADSAVLGQDGLPLGGLYAVGTVTGSMCGVDYNEVTHPGISLGRNVTLGWLLGKHLAGVEVE